MHHVHLAVSETPTKMDAKSQKYIWEKQQLCGRLPVMHARPPHAIMHRRHMRGIIPRHVEASSSTAVWRTRNGEDLSEHEWACELEPRAVAGARASTNAQRLRPSGNYWPAKKRVIGAFSEVDLVAGMVYCSRSSRVSWIDTSSCRQLAAITRIPRNYGTVCVHARIIWILHRPNYFSHAGYIFTCVCLSVCLFGC